MTNCLFCGKEIPDNFRIHNSFNLCSVLCRNRYYYSGFKNMDEFLSFYTKKCLFCGREFVASYKTQKYCSYDCKILYKRTNTRRKEKIEFKSKCIGCGNDFLYMGYVGHKPVKFCNHNCCARYHGRIRKKNKSIKICKRCGEIISSEDLKDKKWLWYCSNCKPIHDLERHRGYDNKRRKNVEKEMWRRSKIRAKNKEYEFNIEVSDIKIPKICPVLGIPIFVSLNKTSDNSPSLDRIDSSKGYIKGNIAVISRKANSIKSYGTSEEHRKIANWIDLVMGKSTESAETEK